ncbi:MAG: DUF4115 domain-containing protein [Pseudomonadota bacterium]
MSEVETVDEIISLENLGFGNILRNAREKKGLSLADVGRELRLDESIIYAIENHNLEQLPEPAYVCGYIRNYSRLMEIEAKPLLDNFKQDVSLKSNLSSVNSIGRTIEKKHEKRTVFFLLFLVTLLAVGGFLGWQLWENKQLNIFSKETSGTTDNSVMALHQEAMDSSSNDKQNFVNALVNMNEPIQIESGSIDLPEEKKSQLQDIENSNIQEMSEVQDNLQEDEEIKKIPSEDMQQEENTLATEQITAIKPATESNTTSDIDPATDSETKPQQLKKQLQFKFTKNSWISVKDGDTKSLIYDLIHKGESLTFSGKLPVNIFLGDGTGVELTVDGKLFDFTQFINKKNIAKFVLE